MQFNFSSVSLPTVIILPRITGNQKAGHTVNSQQKTHADTLRYWLNARSKYHTQSNFFPGPSSVSLVAYHFWNSKCFDSQFDSLSAAIRETWCHCGWIRTILVVNHITTKIEDFASTSNGMVQIDLCASLTPGNLYSMSVDCISRLSSRFNTDYVLIVQNDGFPIRPGLESFLGTYDYWGAPWQFGKDDWITRFLLRHRSDVGNGGFSLRSKRLCEMSSWYYRKKYKLIPHCFLMTEDYFICKTLPSFEKLYRETVQFAPADAAATFSLEDNIELHEYLHASPFGFHSPAAFAYLQRKGLIPCLDGIDPCCIQT